MTKSNWCLARSDIHSEARQCKACGKVIYEMVGNAFPLDIPYFGLCQQCMSPEQLSQIKDGRAKLLSFWTTGRTE